MHQPQQTEGTDFNWLISDWFVCTDSAGETDFNWLISDSDLFVQTQPVPNPISYFLHQSPEIFHKFETLTNHFVELVAPWFLIGPRRLCMIGGTIQILFQVRSWNSGYRQFSVVWHVWYFVQFEWHIHNIKVLYLSFLHERNIKISFDIGLRLLPDYVRDLMFLCYLSGGF